MTRVRFKKDDLGNLVSFRTFRLKDGRDVLVKVNDVGYTLEEVGSGFVVSTGASKNRTYRLRLAKDALRKLVDENAFNVEVRTDRI